MYLFSVYVNKTRINTISIFCKITYNMNPSNFTRNFQISEGSEMRSVGVLTHKTRSGRARPGHIRRNAGVAKHRKHSNKIDNLNI